MKNNLVHREKSESPVYWFIHEGKLMVLTSMMNEIHGRQYGFVNWLDPLDGFRFQSGDMGVSVALARSYGLKVFKTRTLIYALRKVNALSPEDMSLKNRIYGYIVVSMVLSGWLILLPMRLQTNLYLSLSLAWMGAAIFLSEKIVSVILNKPTRNGNTEC